ncbi:hypothetical protein ASPBRDRAFT_62031 [Aspergillus brasiliensis CBS 101740]|uniref:Uncharacterized protein n=1 Tax=Aspergillus brasiliensis (strain CBS 101740 / IMI 381727 / IBT 21946) TaxID=767769 RepID=A0A1L9UVI8_ASPBC|nr:hypothetical protein ASPBRDRAFT_62031 [Aspergillus brasiliensis CBS 101740]
MKFTLINLMLVGATLALPADISSQKSKRDNQGVQEATVDDHYSYVYDLGTWLNTKRDNQDAQEATVKEDWPFGPGLRNPADKYARKGVAFRDLTGTEPTVKRDN